ncbi:MULTISPECIES: NMCC_0638 family (lipo)protein [Shewanella]|uniref:NMCC_0638 family (lipo)protein n=1 Tax=Shewanella TaxID=22 RepID=UPI001184C960|nr:MULTISPECIES: hypothetical protein [unclassified Shewanella]NDO73293.1 hypothetical protein [Shewanella sp. SE1]BCV36684.1 hypothetical protein TUM17377_20120 [Shewanella chilikensis]
MNRVKSYIIAIFLVSVAGCKSTSEKEDESLALRKSTPIQLFMGTCVVGRQSPAALEESAKRKGFVLAPKQIAQNYLKGNAGKAWHLNNSEGSFGLALLQNKLCSVYVHQGDPNTIQASMEAWLPPKGSGFTYKKELISQSANLSTTSYTLYQGSSFLEQWVITINSAKPSDLVAVMSYKGV